jgi:protein ImuB
MIGTSSGCRDPDHVCRLMAEKLAAIDAGLGIDVATLDALNVVPLAATQSALAAPSGRASERGTLIDRLANRLGASRIVCLAPVASHQPERATLTRPAMMEAGAKEGEASELSIPTESWKRPSTALRPPLLIVPPEPVVVVAEIPDGAPARLVWRRVPRRIVRSEGPERIEPEWWRGLAVAEERRPGTRDYYRLEDETGAGYWVFREGLYGEEGREPRWFMHGMWA